MLPLRSADKSSTESSELEVASTSTLKTIPSFDNSEGEVMSKDNFSTSFNLTIFNEKSTKQKNFTDWMLDFQAMTGVEGIEQALNS